MQANDQNFAEQGAHLIAAELIRAKAKIADATTERLFCRSANATVTVTIEAGDSATTSPATSTSSTIKEEILAVVPAFTDKPVSLARLAKLCDYSYSKHFRDAVAELVEDLILLETRRGLRRFPTTSEIDNRKRP